jgi:RNA polymerase sigma-70 factor (ECF subfamily)
MSSERPTELQTRPTLLLRLRNPCDLQSWRTFVDVYGPLAYGYCRQRGLRHEDAEDVTQEVFVRIGAAIRTFEYRPDIGRFRDWMGTLIRNEVNRFLKKTKSATKGRGGADSDGVLNGVEARGKDTLWVSEFNAHVLATALARSRPHFDERTWRAFALVWLENCPAAQAAQQLGQSIDFVYVAKSRVLKRLWHEVQELADDTVLLALSPGQPV